MSRYLQASIRTAMIAGGPVRQAVSLMPHSFPRTGISAEVVGRPPGSARVPLDPLSCCKINAVAGAGSRPGGRLRTWASAPQVVQMLARGKSMRH